MVAVITIALIALFEMYIPERITTKIVRINRKTIAIMSLTFILKQ